MRAAMIHKSRNGTPKKMARRAGVPLDRGLKSAWHKTFVKQLAKS